MNQGRSSLRTSSDSMGIQSDGHATLLILLPVDEAVFQQSVDGFLILGSIAAVSGHCARSRVASGTFAVVKLVQLPENSLPR